MTQSNQTPPTVSDEKIAEILAAAHECPDILRAIAKSDRLAECRPEEHDAWAAAKFIEDAASALSTLRSQLDALTAERDEARQHVEALQVKIDPDEHCACGFDAGTDDCLHHSPIVHALQARLARQEEALKRAASELERLRKVLLPHYEGKVGEPSATVLDAVYSALQEPEL